MKKCLYFLSLLFIILCYGCNDQKNEFVIKGTVPQERLNGWRVFLVPCDPKSTLFTSKAFEDSIGVDSVEIKDGKFEFRGKGEYLARITIDKKVRYGTQDLLVVTEPGKVVEVTIDSISHGGGTPQNEALQRWKDMKHAHDRVSGPVLQHIFYLRHKGDTIRANEIADSLRQYNEKFRLDVIDIANILGSGTAYDVLTSHYGKK